MLNKEGRFLGCPNGGRILEYFQDYFSAVQVVLFPFLRPRSIPIERFEPGTYPSRSEILHDCLPVTWAEVLRLSRFSNLSEIDVALRSSIGGLNRPKQNLVDLLIETLITNDLIPPSAGDIAPHVEQTFLTGLRSIGYKHVLVSDEFGEGTWREEIPDLINEDSLPSHAVLETEDGSLLFATHWDSHCSFLCGNLPDRFPDLEKFRCSERTEVYWGLYPL